MFYVVSIEYDVFSSDDDYVWTQSKYLLDKFIQYAPILLDANDITPEHIQEFHTDDIDEFKEAFNEFYGTPRRPFPFNINHRLTLYYPDYGFPLKTHPLVLSVQQEEAFSEEIFSYGTLVDEATAILEDMIKLKLFETYLSERFKDPLLTDFICLVRFYAILYITLDYVFEWDNGGDRVNDYLHYEDSGTTMSWEQIESITIPMLDNTSYRVIESRLLSSGDCNKPDN